MLAAAAERVAAVLAAEARHVSPAPPLSLPTSPPNLPESRQHLPCSSPPVSSPPPVRLSMLPLPCIISPPPCASVQARVAATAEAAKLAEAAHAQAPHREQQP